MGATGGSYLRKKKKAHGGTGLFEFTGSLLLTVVSQEHKLECGGSLGNVWFSHYVFWSIGRMGGGQVCCSHSTETEIGDQMNPGAGSRFSGDLILFAREIR